MGTWLDWILAVYVTCKWSLAEVMMERWLRPYHKDGRIFMAVGNTESS